MALLKLENIRAGYDDNIVLDNFNLEVEEGELVSFLGPSGCGKTTTLRVIAGFVAPNKGKVYFSGQDYTPLSVHKKNFGFVFQSYALFPHLSVYDNVAFGLKMRNVSRSETDKRVKDILEMVGLERLVDRHPGELSGGQQQRVALARALVINPDLLLLDEPLSNLDAKLRLQMRREIKSLQSRLGVTTVYVTHDQEECFSISDRVVIMRDGRIEQFDSPEKIYDNPGTSFVAEFVGFKNFFECTFIRDNLVDLAGLQFEIAPERIMPSAKGEKEIICGIRPTDIEVTSKKEADKTEKRNRMSGEIMLSTYLGDEYEYVVAGEKQEMIVNCPSDKKLKQGEEVELYFPPDKLIGVK